MNLIDSNTVSFRFEQLKHALQQLLGKTFDVYISGVRTNDNSEEKYSFTIVFSRTMLGIAQLHDSFDAIYAYRLHQLGPDLKVYSMTGTKQNLHEVLSIVEKATGLKLNGFGLETD